MTAQGFDGAASAIFETSGTVRPCAHGQSVGRKEDTTATLNAALWQQSLSCGRDVAALIVRRNALFAVLVSVSLAEEAYCKLMRDVPRRCRFCLGLRPLCQDLPAGRRTSRCPVSCASRCVVSVSSSPLVVVLVLYRV